MGSKVIQPMGLILYNLRQGLLTKQCIQIDLECQPAITVCTMVALPTICAMYVSLYKS